MAGNARFHNKLHRKDHHTNPTEGFPDSGTDPIASPQEPFQGDFVINGTLSCTGFQVASADFSGDVKCENLTVRDTTLCNFISGDDTETIISDGALTGFGDFTMTMDFRQGIYAKTPKFNITGILSCDQSANIGTNLQVNGNSTINGNLLINGDLSILGDSCIINTTVATTSSLSVYNTGNSSALTISQITTTYPIAIFKNNTTSILEISSNGINVTGNGIFTGSVNAVNINILQSASSKWDSSYNNLTAQSANWNNTFNSVNITSANWNNTFTSVKNASADWNNTFNSVNYASANWNNTFTSVTSNSSNWNNVFTSVKDTSANWNNVFTSVKDTSANWNNVYTSVKDTSANWNNVYTTVRDNSAGDWLSGNSTINFVASTGTFTHQLSTKSIKIHNAMYAAILSATLTGTISLTIDSGTYLFINCNGIARDLELPAVNSEHKGLMYMIKNTSPTNVDLHVHYNGGLAQPAIVSISYGTYKRIFASGVTNNWLVM